MGRKTWPLEWLLLDPRERRVNRVADRVEEGEQRSEDLHAHLMEVSGRVGRLELLVQALLRLAVQQGTPVEALQRLVRQIDLEDGYEDGKIGEPRIDAPPACGDCGKPRNPEAGSCPYCGVEQARVVPDNRPDNSKPMLTCGRCYRRIPETEAVMTTDGLRCQPCSERVGASGRLTVADDGEGNLELSADEEGQDGRLSEAE
ncbi:MAG: hypothetical protein KC561_01805 [Myxococcales bacterium]|nr:hypothetical protein [Myxococcales bacterium]